MYSQVRHKYKFRNNQTIAHYYIFIYSVFSAICITLNALLICNVFLFSTDITRIALTYFPLTMFTNIPFKTYICIKCHITLTVSIYYMVSPQNVPSIQLLLVNFLFMKIKFSLATSKWYFTNIYSQVSFKHILCNQIVNQNTSSIPPLPSAIT